MNEKLYVTFTTKPLSVAASEGLLAVEASVMLSELDGPDLLHLVEAAAKRLEGSHATA